MRTYVIQFDINMNNGLLQKVYDRKFGNKKSFIHCYLQNHPRTFNVSQNDQIFQQLLKYFINPIQ